MFQSGRAVPQLAEEAAAPRRAQEWRVQRAAEQDLQHEPALLAGESQTETEASGLPIRWSAGAGRAGCLPSDLRALQSIPPVPCPAGYLHDPGGRAVAVDAAGVLAVLLLVVAHVRPHLVADRLHARRPGARAPPRQPGGVRLEAVRRQHPRLRLLLPVLRGDAAHDRLRRPRHHRGVPRGHLRHVPAEHRRRHDPGP